MEPTSPARTPPQPNEPQQPPSPSPTPTPSPSPSFSLPPSTLPSSSSPNPNPQTSQLTIPFSRPWEQQQQQQQPSHFRHFSSPPFSTSAPPSTSVPPPSQGGGMAIGVPAHHSSPPMPPTSFSSLNPPSFRQQFGGLARNTASAPDSVAGTSTPQARQPIQGNQGMGIKGSMGSGPPMRSSGMALQHQPRPVQSSVKPQNNLNNQSLTSQNLQGHGMSRVATVGSPGSPSPSTSQSMQPHNQPWLSPGTPGKPPLPTPPFRPQMNPQSLQQRSHIPQQHHHSVSTASQLPQTSSSQNQQQSSSLHGPPENCGQQFPSSRVTQSLPHQQQIPRGPGLGNQKPSANSVLQPSTVSSGFSDKTLSTEIGESCDRIISKRTIQDLVAQIDPSERLDPEVEDILVDIADEFVESITTYGCLLAKHRKSTTLEAKDILLHLERNWNMTLPGFGGDEIKCFRKPFVNDIHRERVSVIKKSAAISDIAKSSVGQAAGNAKGHLTKVPAANVIGSPDPKMREGV